VPPCELRFNLGQLRELRILLRELRILLCELRILRRELRLLLGELRLQLGDSLGRGGHDHCRSQN